jgi:hypothetical protein
LAPPEVIHVMPYWPRHRYLERAPAYWPMTRARLDEKQLTAEPGHVTVPPALTDTLEQVDSGLTSP